jgi:hypothetical protein
MLEQKDLNELEMRLNRCFVAVEDKRSLAKDLTGYDPLRSGI